MGKASKDKIDSKFSLKTMVSRIEEVYDFFVVRKKDLIMKRRQGHD